jgi:hypothetical protein
MTAAINKKSEIVDVRYVLAVKNLKKSSEYYKIQLGFKTIWDGEGWHFLEREKFIIMLGECPKRESSF